MRREWYCLAIHKNTRKRTVDYAGAVKETAEKVGFRHLLSSFFLSFFLLSHTKLLTSIAYKLKQILSYFTHRTTLLSSQQPLSARLPANWQEWRFWLAAVPRSCNTPPFWATNKVEVQTCTYCACAVHMLMRFTTLCLSDGCVRVAYRILVNPTSGGSRPLGGIPTNLYLWFYNRITRRKAIVVGSTNALYNIATNLILWSSDDGKQCYTMPGQTVLSTVTVQS